MSEETTNVEADSTEQVNDVVDTQSATGSLIPDNVEATAETETTDTEDSLTEEESGETEDTSSETEEGSGVPEGDYEIVVPEGVDFQFYEDGEYGISQFQDMAKEMGLNQEAFSKLTEFYIHSRAQDEAMLQDAREQAQFEVFGKDAAKEVSGISAKAKYVLGEDFSILQDAASGSPTAAANAIKVVGVLLDKLGGEYSQGTHAPVEPPITEESLDALRRSPDWNTNPAVRKQYNEGLKKLYDK